MTNNRMWILLAAVVLLTGYSQFRVLQLGQQVKDVAPLQEALSEQTSESLQAIESASELAIKSLRDMVESDLVSSAKTISDQQSHAIEERLQRLTDEVSKREAEIRSAEDKRDRTLNGLPEHVSLEQLNDYYAALWKKETGYASKVESFTTALGPISFQKNNFTFAYIPSSRLLASVKIGKNNSSENSELIKTWLDEAARAKVQLGYVRQYKRDKPADYGEYTEALYTKGDMYFKTFLQFQRIQGTYNRHSLQYTYYVETGSDARRKQYELEQYNNKLGS